MVAVKQVDSSNPNQTLNVSGNVNGAIIKQTKTVSMSDISLIKSMTFVGNLNNLDVRFAVSKDQGATWQTYNQGS